MTDYDLMCRQLESLSEGVDWDITVLSNAAALIWDTLEDINWAGFYLMKDGKLLLGPFQGKPKHSSLKTFTNSRGISHVTQPAIQRSSFLYIAEDRFAGCSI